MMTPLMHQICGVLERQLDPQLWSLIVKQYHERSGGRGPTSSRAGELRDRCFKDMREAVEKAFDLKEAADKAQAAAVVAIKNRLTHELDLEFPPAVVHG